MVRTAPDPLSRSSDDRRGNVTDAKKTAALQDGDAMVPHWPGAEKAATYYSPGAGPGSPLHHALTLLTSLPAGLMRRWTVT